MKYVFCFLLLLSSLQTFAIESKELKRYLELIDKKAYAKTWEESSPYFQRTLTKEQWVSSLTVVLSPLGKNISRKLLKEKAVINLPGAPKGKYKIYTLESKFKIRDKIIETITFSLGKDKKWKMVGHYIK